eukprot:747872-Pyramimonas_sp.AAC.1
MALSCISVLSEVASVFAQTQHIAHLKLKIPKRLIVPLIDSAAPNCISKYRLWIRNFLGSWSDIGIPGKLKYLEMFLGPDVDEDSWIAPVAKYNMRCAMIAGG